MPAPPEPPATGTPDAPGDTPPSERDADIAFPTLKKSRLAFTAIFMVVLVDLIGFGIIIPVMPDLLTQVTGLSRSQAAPYGGYILFLFATIQFFATPILGGLADRYGRRPVVLLSLLGYAVDFAIMGLTKSLAVLFVGRAFSGFFAATYATSNAVVADITAPSHRAQRFGILGAAFGLGFMIGPAIGGLLGDAFGARAPFFAASALAALNFVFCFFFFPETLRSENKRAFSLRRANPLGSLVQLGKYPVMIPILITVFLFQVSQFSLQTTWSWITGAKFGWTAKDIGYSLMAVGLSAAIVQGVLLRFILPVTGEKLSVLLGGLAAFTALMFYAFLPEGWMIYPVIAMGAFGALAQAAVQSLMSRTIPANAQGELQGAVAVMLSLAAMVGPVIMTQTFSVFADDAAPIYFPGAPFLLGGGMILLSAIPTLIAFQRVTGPDPLLKKNAQ
ncbi:MAG: TCR/Tet family MFS transporter [Pseudomonadota bacterium]